MVMEVDDEDSSIGVRLLGLRLDIAEFRTWQLNSNERPNQIQSGRRISPWLNHEWTHGNHGEPSSLIHLWTAAIQSGRTQSISRWTADWFQWFDLIWFVFVDRMDLVFDRILYGLSHVYHTLQRQTSAGFTYESHDSRASSSRLIIAMYDSSRVRTQKAGFVALRRSWAATVRGQILEIPHQSAKEWFRSSIVPHLYSYIVENRQNWTKRRRSSRTVKLVVISFMNEWVVAGNGIYFMK